MPPPPSRGPAVRTHVRACVPAPRGSRRSWGSRCSSTPFLRDAGLTDVWTVWMSGGGATNTKRQTKIQNQSFQTPLAPRRVC
eukprot:scaffold9199_cov61-Phaeocystis_antarctica.AAC.2